MKMPKQIATFEKVVYKLTGLYCDARDMLDTRLYDDFSAAFRWWATNAAGVRWPVAEGRPKTDPAVHFWMTWLTTELVLVRPLCGGDRYVDALKIIVSWAPGKGKV